MKAIGKHQNIIEYIEFGKNVERVFVEKEMVKKTNCLALDFAANKSLINLIAFHSNGEV
jgi:hypothetical protein